MTFAEFLKQREPGRERTGPVPGVADDRNIEGPTIDGDAVHPGSQDDRDRLAVRSMLRGLFKAVNPVCPLSTFRLTSPGTAAPETVQIADDW